jgi:Flp pilus assembly protein TadD
LLLLLLLTATAHARGSFAHSYRLINEWRVTEARNEIAELPSGESGTVFLDGYLKFLDGDYAKAAELLREATLRLPGRGEIADEARELRDLAISTEKATHDMKPTAGAHFVVWATAGDQVIVPYALDALEKAYSALADDFGDSSAEPVRVEIYPEVADLARVSTLTLKEIETSGTIALCKYNRLMIVSPRALLAGYPWLDTLNHEYTHFVVSRVSHNSVPIWLHEGLAKYEERRWRKTGGSGLSPTAEHLLALAVDKKKLITFEAMHPSMAKLPSQEDTALAFAEVYMAVAYLAEKVGWDGIRKIVAEMRDGKTDEQAVAVVVGRSFGAWQREWRGWLDGKKLKTHPGLFPTALKFKKNTAKKGAGDEDATDIPEERARKMARLGGLLRARHRLRAAAVEYEKANKLLGLGNPQVSHKLGRTYLELGEADRAIAVVEPALANYPDLAGPQATLGESWLKKGDFARAEPYFLDALAISPFDPALHCGLEKIYRARADNRAEREAAACKDLSQ